MRELESILARRRAPSGRRARDVERSHAEIVLEHLQHEDVGAQRHAELESARIDDGANTALLKELRLAQLDVIRDGSAAEPRPGPTDPPWLRAALIKSCTIRKYPG